MGNEAAEKIENTKETSARKTKKSKSVKYYRPSLERLRIILMGLICIYLYGFPTKFGDFIQTVCGFVPLAFYIISGYLVLRQSENRSKRILRAIKRSAVAFVTMTVVFFILSYIYNLNQGVNILPSLQTKDFWYNFIFLNVWPFEIGKALWYVQALLYAYIIIFILDKLKLLKFDWIFFSVLLIITVFGGEFNGLFPWNIKGYTYIPGNFLTRALPYILLGAFIHRKAGFFRKISRTAYVVGFVCGIVLIALEQLVLAMLGYDGYYGHLIGMGVMAFSVCMIAIKAENKSGFEERLGLKRGYTNIIYYINAPVCMMFVLLIPQMRKIFEQSVIDNFFSYISIVTFVISFFTAWVIANLSKRIKIKIRILREKRRKKKKKNELKN